MPLTDRATNILKLLEVKQLAKHPIIFVTHSMGGLVVKQLLRNAIDSAMPEWRLIVEQTKGIVFLSTPHTGSDLASLMESFKWLYRPTISVMQLKAHASELLNLNLWYRNNAADHAILTEVYFETQNMHGFRVVNPTSADPGMTRVIPIPVSADHNSITLISSKQDFLYRCIRNFISKCSTTQDVLIPDAVQLKNLCNALDEIFNSINTLDDQFLELIKGFKDRDVVSDKVRLKDHIRIANTYLTNRRSLPTLIKGKGSIDYAAENTRIQAITNRTPFMELRKALDEYMQNLSQGQIMEVGRALMTGIGLNREYNLIAVCDYGQSIIDKPNGAVSDEDIVNMLELATKVSYGYNPALSERIQRHIGEVRNIVNC